MQHLYPKFGDFCELRKKLDPDGLFMNDYLRRVLEADSDVGKRSKFTEMTQFKANVAAADV